MQLGSEFDRKKVKVLLCGSHLHFNIIILKTVCRNDVHVSLRCPPYRGNTPVSAPEAVRQAPPLSYHIL